MVEKYIGPFIEGLREHGFPEKLIKEAEDFATRMREHGIPDDFPREEAVNTRLEVQDPAQRLTEGRKRLIEVLSIQRVESGKPVLTDELARSINKEIGQYLEDDVIIRDLILPSTSPIYKYQRNKQQAFSIEGFERLEQVNLLVKVSYNRALTTLIRRGYSRMGEIRNADPFSMLQEHAIGVLTLNFVKTAFARPQPHEGQV